MSEARRSRLLALAQQAGIVILEDDFVGDLRYTVKACRHCAPWLPLAR